MTFTDIGREPYANENIKHMPTAILVALLRLDAGEYSAIATDTRDPNRDYSWDQGNVRTWEAARRLEQADINALAALAGRPPRPSDAITKALGTDDWIIVSSTRPLGKELIPADELDALAGATPAPLHCGVLAPEELWVKRHDGTTFVPTCERPADHPDTDVHESIAGDCRWTVDATPAPAPRACRTCSCTDDDCSDCIERTGQPCWWVEADLCSACIDRTPGTDAPGALTPCPECTAGKHSNCRGAWDFTTDQPAPCPCICNDVHLADGATA